MSVATVKTPECFSGIGEKMHRLVSELYPLCRSITGNGVRETLRIVSKHIPLDVYEIPSGTRVFDWTIPREWNIVGAHIKNSRGEKILDFQNSNLHVVNYSVPVRERLSLAELKRHLFTLPDHPGCIPYQTSYYQENWGFCMAHDQYLSLEEDEYEVVIDSSLVDGHLTYGEYYLNGQRADEVLISCHICHPSLCNDNLSGLSLSVFLAKHLASLERRYSYRFLFIPATIGSIAWLAQNEGQVDKIKHGLVIACVGDPGMSTYKKSRRGDAEIDRAVTHVLKHSGEDYEITEFIPYGYDERQYCSPGFDLPVGCFMRTPHGRFPEYHTSADNLEFVQPVYLEDSFVKASFALAILENNRTYRNQNPKCEPQLGKRGLYRTTGGKTDNNSEMAMLWLLNLSDGQHSLLDIAERSGIKFESIRTAASKLVGHGLLAEEQKYSSCTSGSDDEH
jgi:aminopeptidase-like protein